ncbi:MAG: hypothetical protein PCFJNLEI_01679 [Verrucomicrobiae bacterium]|nr:hypothetical protein [Verrucomicrobiae bacterium]
MNAFSGYRYTTWLHDLSPWLSDRPRLKPGKREGPAVLVVDENIAPLITFVYLLNNHGLPACGAGSLREALDTLRRGDGSFRVVVASTSVIQLGAGTLARARRSEFPNLRVIAVAEAPGIEFAQKTDCFAYLERPFRVEQFLDLVREAMRQSTVEEKRA